MPSQFSPCLGNLLPLVEYQAYPSQDEKDEGQNLSEVRFKFGDGHE